MNFNERSEGLDLETLTKKVQKLIKMVTLGRVYRDRLRSGDRDGE